MEGIPTNENTTNNIISEDTITKSKNIDEVLKKIGTFDNGKTIITKDELSLLKLADLLNKTNGTTYLEIICKNSITLPNELYKEIISNEYALEIYTTNSHYLDVGDLCIKLFNEENGALGIDKYMNNDKLMKHILSAFKYYDSESFTPILNYWQKTQDYRVLENCGYDKFAKIDTNNNIFESLVAKGLDAPFVVNKKFTINDKEKLDILIKYNRIDLLNLANIDLLLSKYDEKNTYLDIMINESKKGKEIHFENIKLDFNGSKSSETLASIITELTKNNLIGYLNDKISYIDLLYKGENDKKTVIEWVREKGKDIDMANLNKIINSGKEDPNFIIALKSVGIDDIMFSVPINVDEIDVSKIYTDEFNNSFKKNLSSSNNETLNKLKELFYSDGKSNKELIDSLILSYESYLETNPELATIEIEKLIDIKINNYDTFIYKYYKEETGKFDDKSHKIELKYPIISAINHETGHALHFFLTNFSIPENFFEAVEQQRYDPDILLKIKELTNRIKNQRNEYRKKIDEIPNFKTYFEKKYTDKGRSKVIDFLNNQKEEQKEMLTGEYQEETLNTILDSTFSIDAFIEERKKIEADELVYTMMLNGNYCLNAISDIVDAILMGKLQSGIITDDNNVPLTDMPGHGIEYYSENNNYIFYEMIANYSAILKDKNSVQYIQYLRNIVGDEIVNILDDYYKNKILGMNIQLENTEEEKPHVR